MPNHTRVEKALKAMHAVRSKNRSGREAGALCRGGKAVPEALWYNFADGE
jgi:hypothetical protein